MWRDTANESALMADWFDNHLGNTNQCQRQNTINSIELVMSKHPKFNVLVICLVIHFQFAVQAQPTWELPSNSEISELLAQRMEQNGVGIVVGVIDRNGRRVVSHGHTGAVDHRPLDGDSIFQIGSLTKTLTALLFSDLVASGELGLEDSADTYIPGDVSLPNITLKHLATHTSGLPSMPRNLDISAKPNPVEGYLVSDLYEFLDSFEPDSSVGSTWSYSNLGVSLLGRIIANRTEMTYEEVLTERILSPLQMYDTTITLSDNQLSRVMPGHDRYLNPVETWEMRTMPASGSLRSSVNDLLEFVELYLEPRDSPLSQAVEIQLSNRVPNNSGEQALGWVILPGEIIQHSGGKSGYRSGIAINTQLGYGAVVLANARTDDLPINIALYLATGAPLADAPIAPESDPIVSLSTEQLEEIVGTYQFESGNEYEVGATNSMLLIRYPSGAILEFAPVAANSFFYIAGNDDVEFVLGPNNEAQMILYPNGKSDGLQFRADRISRSN